MVFLYVSSCPNGHRKNEENVTSTYYPVSSRGPCLHGDDDGDDVDPGWSISSVTFSSSYLMTSRLLSLSFPLLSQLMDSLELQAK